MSEPRKWDRHAILAEIRRQGMTLTGIARDAGLYDSACRAGILGMNRKGAQAIADALDRPFRELFADSYSRGRHDEQDRNRNGQRKASPKAPAETDAATVSS